MMHIGSSRARWFYGRSYLHVGVEHERMIEAEHMHSYDLLSSPTATLAWLLLEMNLCCTELVKYCGVVGIRILTIQLIRGDPWFIHRSGCVAPHKRHLRFPRLGHINRPG